MTLTTEQLAELTKRIAARYLEFERGMTAPSRGEIRLIASVIEEWMGLDLPDAGAGQFLNTR